MAVLKVKNGVQPKLVHLLAAISRAAGRLHNPSEVWITSGIEGQHSPDSLHYALRAVDIRTRNFPTMNTLDDFIIDLRVELGPDYDIVKEATHLHVEWDK